MSTETPPRGGGASLAAILKWGFLIVISLMAIGFIWDRLPKPDTRPQAAKAAPAQTLPPLKNYRPTPENEARLRLFVRDVLQFTLLHETGHLVFTQYKVPVGSGDVNERAADSFAATIMLAQLGKGSGPQHSGLASAAIFWRAVGLLEAEGAIRKGDAENEPGIDFHPPPEERAVKLACLLYGADPSAFADLALSFKIEHKQAACADEAAATRNDWGRVISVNLDPDAGRVIDRWAPSVAVQYHDAPIGLPDGRSAILAHDQELASSLKILDSLGANILRLKTPFNISAGLARGAQHPGASGRSLTDGLIDANGRLRLHAAQVDHPTGNVSPSEYDYLVVGDSCLNDDNQPAMNAYWNPDNHTVTLCYAWVDLIEYVGKRLLADRR